FVGHHVYDDLIIHDCPIGLQYETNTPADDEPPYDMTLVDPVFDHVSEPYKYGPIQTRILHKADLRDIHAYGIMNPQVNYTITPNQGSFIFPYEASVIGTEFDPLGTMDIATQAANRFSFNLYAMIYGPSPVIGHCEEPNGDYYLPLRYVVTNRLTGEY